MTKLVICLILTIWLTPHVSSYLFDFSTYTPGAPNGKIQLTGPNDNATLGYAVTGGDINGDGLSDILIGGCLPGSDLYLETCKSIIYVLYGSKTNLFQVNLTNISPSQGFTITEAEKAEGARPAQFSISTEGDVNGDGIDDIIIGDSTVHYLDRDQSGAAYVIFGSRSNLPNINLDDPLNSTQGYRIFGAKTYDGLGTAISYAGDVNGDGINDIIIGAYEAYAYNGAAYILYGSKKTSDIDLKDLGSTQGIVIQGGYVYDQFGIAVSNVGDVNGDGFDDVIIGASGCKAYADRPESGAAFVIFGGKNLTNIDNVYKITLSQGISLLGAEVGDMLGNSVSAAGDINADGIADILIGASSASPLDRYVAGSTYVIFGSKTNLTNIDFQDTHQFTNKKGFRIVGPVHNNFLGDGLTGVGDVNGDGIDDILIGGWGRNGGTGAVYVIYGSKNGFSQIDLDKLNSKQGVLIMGDKPEDNFGCGVGNAGDVNGDGVNDLIVGACSANREHYFGGLTYVILSPFGSDAIVM